MEAKNLRIGNLILFPIEANNGLLIPAIKRKVDAIEFGKVISLNSPTHPSNFEAYVKNCGGIEITENILLDAGFKKNINYEKEFFELEREYRAGEPLWIVYFNNTLLCNIKYVHELQNLFFAIEGDELSFEIEK